MENLVRKWEKKIPCASACGPYINSWFGPTVFSTSDQTKGWNFLRTCYRLWSENQTTEFSGQNISVLFLIGLLYGSKTVDLIIVWTHISMIIILTHLSRFFSWRQYYLFLFFLIPYKIIIIFNQCEKIGTSSLIN